MKGVIRIIAPSGHSVWHGGIVAKLESTMIDFETRNGKLLLSESLEVAEPDYISYDGAHKSANNLPLFFVSSLQW